jgi:hypothetical protein
VGLSLGLLVQKKPSPESARAPIVSDSIASRLKPRPPTKKAQVPEDKPIRRKPVSRKVKESARSSGTPATGLAPLQTFVESIEVLPAEYYGQIDHGSTDEDTSPERYDTDPQQEFYRAWGYLPPLNEEVTALIEAIMSNPAVAKETLKLINSSKPDMFQEGLRFNRNVLLDETADSDSYARHIESLEPDKFLDESKEEAASHGFLWDKDLERCTQGSNEALFQRTVMMILISRHCLIYPSHKINGTDQRCLDFSVEEPWTCWPMPTRAYQKMKNFLTVPKPDLAVCFVRDAVISDYLWINMPDSTRILARYEKMGERIFHFCTIEAKNSRLSPDDPVARNQCLNNASQSLHNMYEFFKDAGEDHENEFFARVRFFSVVASTEGLTIRIHRAVKDSGTEQGWIVPNYPLRFEYQVFRKFEKSGLNRREVLETFAKIFVGYGVNVLRLLLKDAADALMTKLDHDPNAKASRQDVNFYRYGQIQMPRSSGRSTPAVPTQPTSANVSFMSVDTNQSMTKTPVPGQSFTSSGTARNKRRRTGRSEFSFRSYRYS